MLQTDLSQPSVIALDAAGMDSVVVPGGAWLLKADFSVQGTDLLLTGADGAQVLIRDFFTSSPPPDLVTDGGAVIPAELSIKLAGPQAPGQFALVQNGPFQIAQGAEEPVGKVEATDGLVEAIRTDGSKVALTKGSPIFQGDTIVTGKGAAIGITFVDDTTFSLGENGRMVLDEMVYDPGGQDNTFNANLVQGVFSFVSGQIAKTTPEGMTVSTPVATIGIRGTKVAGFAAQEGEQNTVSLLPETDEQGNTFVGEITITNLGGTVTLNQVGATVQMTSSFQSPPPPVVFSPQQIQQQYGGALNSLPNSPAGNPEQGQDDQGDQGDQGDGAPVQEPGDAPVAGDAAEGPPAGPAGGEGPPAGEPLIADGGLFQGPGDIVPLFGTQGLQPLPLSMPPPPPSVFLAPPPPPPPPPPQLSTVAASGEVRLNPTLGNDTLFGNELNNKVVMVQGSALGGTDTFAGGDGTDEIAFQGLDGVAAIYNASATPDLISYSDANGSITGTVSLTSVEKISASDGTDSHVVGLSPTDSGHGYLVAGTGGNDTISLVSDSSLASSYSGLSSVTGVVLTSGAVLGSIIFGKGGDDTITGSEADDVIFGGAGNDTINGGGTTITSGGEKIFGGLGNDVINVTSATDGSTFDGGAGSDVLSYAGLSAGAISFAITGTTINATRTFNAASVTDGIKGIETLTGTTGSGNSNTFTFSGDSTALALGTLAGGSEADTFVFNTGTVVTAALDGGTGSNTLTINGGTHTLNVSNIGTLNGSAASESLTLAAAHSGVGINLAGGSDSLTLANGTNSLTISGTESITGGTGADSVTLSAALAAGTVNLAGGVDSLTLAAGTNSLTATNIETVIGNSGVDTLTLTGASATTVTGAGGADVLTLSSTGAHTVKYTALADGGDTVNSFNAGASGDVFQFMTSFGGAQTINLTLESLAGAGTTGANVIVANSTLLSATPATALADVQTLLNSLNTANTFISTANKFVVGIIDSGTTNGMIDAGDKYALFYDGNITNTALGDTTLIATMDIDPQTTAASTWHATNFSALA